MTLWLVVATVLAGSLALCVGVAFFAGPAHGLAALQVGGVVASTTLVILSEAFHRQPFVDLALVLAPLSVIGSLTFARLMERTE